MAKRQPRTISDDLRAAILQRGLSIHALAKQAGVSQPVVHRFVTGERDILMGTADRLASFLKLELVRHE